MLLGILSYILIIFGCIVAVADAVVLLFTLVGGFMVAVEYMFAFDIMIGLLWLVFIECIYLGIFFYLCRYCCYQCEAASDFLETMICDIKLWYIRRKAIRHLEKGRIVIFAAGTGSPYFSTDTTAALRASELNAEVILMAKNGVDGIYNADPKVDPTAKKYTKLTHMDIINKGLRVMDTTASSLSMDNNIALVVFNMNNRGNIKKVVEGEEIGTTVEGK